MSQLDSLSRAEWATRDQLAARYQVHPRTVDDWRRRGILPAFVISSRLV